MTRRWVRFADHGVTGFGTLSEDGATIENFAGSMFSKNEPTGQHIAVDKITLLNPVTPSKFIGLWNNYRELAEKLGQAIPEEPLYFVKTPNSYLSPGDTIRAPKGGVGKVFYEGELGIVIGRRCHAVTTDEAHDFIFGYTCVNDVTAVDVLRRDSSFAQWVRAKSFDTFGPFGPVIAEGIDWRSLRVRTLVNGRERQNYPCSDMIHSPMQIVSHLSQDMTLEAGDLIACGTSVGALPMKSGATIEVEIASIGTLANVYLEGEESQ